MPRMRRSWWFWLSFIIAVAFATYFSVRVIMTFTGRGAAATVRSISIRSDSGSRDLSAIAAAAGVAPGTRTYSVSLRDMNARIAAVPGVRRAAVRRMPNGNISSRVQMHRAIALWMDADGLYPLAADGTVVRTPVDARGAGDIVFFGPLPDDVGEITQTVRPIADKIDFLEWIEDRRWNIHTSGGIVVMLPEKDPAAAIATLMLMDKNNRILSKKISRIDMRDSARILVE